MTQTIDRLTDAISEIVNEYLGNPENELHKKAWMLFLRSSFSEELRKANEQQEFEKLAAKNPLDPYCQALACLLLAEAELEKKYCHIGKATAFIADYKRDRILDELGEAIVGNKDNVDNIHSIILTYLGEPGTVQQAQALAQYKQGDAEALRWTAAEGLRDYYCKALGYLVGVKPSPTVALVASEAARAAAEHKKLIHLAEISEKLFG